MELTFASNKLLKQMNKGKAMIKAYGPIQAKRLQIVLTSLRAAPNLGVFAPPYSRPNRCHELIGNRKGQLSVNLIHPYRLIFEPLNKPSPMRPEGGLDWLEVTAIKIKGVEDTHG